MNGRPLAYGLYDPQFEHDACGVGMVCNLKGLQSHDVIHRGLKILVNLSHRGACGCDETTGDGAGILLQLPHRFLRKVAGGIGISLPEETAYASGLVFLPRNPLARQFCMDLFERVIRAEGQEFLGWRNVPQNNEVLGEIARRVEPEIQQIFVGRGTGIKDQAHFERKLYVIRKVVEKAIRESSVVEKGYFYVPTLSSRTMVYKGLMLADQIEAFLPDLADPDMESAMALVHQRYSTNTFPSWELAHPFRFLCHNGEINTLRGNANWLAARQRVFHSPLFGDDLRKLFPIAAPGASDSAILDNAVELLYHAGRSLPHAMSMLIPEAWQKCATMPDEKKAFYQYHACLVEPWDGPASIPFSDGVCVGAMLDRNGLRPSRYTVTKDGFVIMGSETGVLEIDPVNIAQKGRLEPGRMFLVDMSQGRIVDDEEIKSELAGRKPYRAWLNKHLVSLDQLPPVCGALPQLADSVGTLQKLFGYSLEDLRIVMAPMARTGVEATGSMGVDVPIAVLSERAQLLYSYFKQLFAQVTNPPLDAIREELVTSLRTSIGAARNLLDETAAHCHQLSLPQPVLTDEDLERICASERADISAIRIPMVFDAAGGGDALEAAMEGLCAAAESAILGGYEIVILSDRTAGRELAPIPALLACAGVHHHLIRTGLRQRCGLMIESGEPREVHHFATLFGYGASAVNPYLAFETLRTMIVQGALDMDPTTAASNYIKAINKGVLKVMSKMGISTLQSYKGAQQFEALGLSRALVDKYFTWTPSRIGGVGLDELAREGKQRYDRAFPPAHIPAALTLDAGGLYQWRRNGEKHLYHPLAIAKLQQATRENNAAQYEEFARIINDQSRELSTIRGLFDFAVAGDSVPLDEVEPWTEIVKRFKTGAMSYGSISQEAHEALAIAMNRLGGKSNSGEGGEDSERYEPMANGDLRSSAIKQIASGRFGVTSYYLANAKELQIKMAQGAKPGEGGQLPAEKVYPWIAKTRHSTPYVQLISPPPHHDIYSIEDLAQLIHDLKNANPEARVSVKLVSEVGVGTVAAGVAKGKADVVLISGYDGGTGASPETSLKHAGLPWELGLAETHQTLVLNGLRSRIAVECDGKLLTGRDVAIACLLGAEEFGFATTPLITLGCVMMRVCHLNTCPVGIATQDPELRKKFAGKPEYVVNFLRFVAEELRGIMANLGFRTLDEMVGRVDKLVARETAGPWKAAGLDLSAILRSSDDGGAVAASERHCTQKQNHNLDKALDHELIAKAAPALERGEPVSFEQRIRNTNRTVGTMLSYRISKKYGEAGLPDDTIRIKAVGSCGQSFSAFGARGITFEVEGDANDYFGKGLSGAKLIIYPPRAATFAPEQNILVGNVALYGAIRGESYIRGLAGERFAVRNSGVEAVVEGVGDHGCEYMTGGMVIVLGKTGRNFAAGMSGGVAYVLDETGDFGAHHCNLEMVGLEPVTDARDSATLRRFIEKHLAYTGSTVAKRVLDQWETLLPKFVKVMPTDYKKALEKMSAEQQLAAVEGLPAGELADAQVK